MVRAINTNGVSLKLVFHHCFSDFTASLNAATIIINDRSPLLKVNRAFAINLTEKQDDCLLNIRSLFHSCDNKVHRELRDTHQSGHKSDIIMPVEKIFIKKKKKIAFFYNKKHRQCQLIVSLAVFCLTALKFSTIMTDSINCHWENIKRLLIILLLKLKNLQSDSSRKCRIDSTHHFRATNGYGSKGNCFQSSGHLHVQSKDKCQIPSIVYKRQILENVKEKRDHQDQLDKPKSKVAVFTSIHETYASVWISTQPSNDTI